MPKPQNFVLPLIQVTQTSKFSPASPDPSGIAYISHLGGLLIADGEVDEISRLFTGKNLFQTNLKGNLQNTFTTISFSDEPTGVAYNPDNRFLYISDDNKRKIFQLNPGGDGQYNTKDDVVTSFNTLSFGSDDPEDVTYSTKTGNLFIVDGAGAQVYEVTTKGNLVSQFDTAKLGLLDPEGIFLDPGSGHLFMVGHPNNLVFELTTSGEVVNTYDISAAKAIKPAGITIAPTSNDPTKQSLYIVDRAIDNDPEPNENDGRIYEFALGTSGGNPPPVNNQAPTVNAGEDQVILKQAILNASISDDGLPNPPASLTNTWSKLSGPGNVSFANAKTEDTTATFSQPGSYVLQLTANDSKLTTSDQVSVLVLDPQSTSFFSLSGSGTVGGVAFDDEDILAYNRSTKSWSMYFDGSDVGLSSRNVRDFHINPDGSILFSLDGSVTLTGVGKVEKQDIVKFTPTSTGNTTSGSFELYFDGSDVGLSTSDEAIDGIAFTPDGQLVLSTTGKFDVPDNSGNIKGTDKDLIAFNATSFGADTAGTWNLYFQGSDVGLTKSSEDINGVWIDQNNKLYLTTKGAFEVPGVTGDGSDIFTFTPTSLGSNTNGNYTPFWDGVDNGLAGVVVDGFTQVF
ncbi:beta-L-arabinobiosidase [Calothrix sp. NIES-2100]|uniref:PKD domain-containing protein n=1 Tax=Calothrix sp. NIES-2100 TaxID=1954172 RepID=UPI000B5E0D2E|nr:beta-L-arabinobiosidase [Calothrix sp. NIES-2100]